MADGSDVQVVAPEVPSTPVDVTPEVTGTDPVAPVEGNPEKEPAPKTFTQEELDAAIGKRLAREQRKWEREQRELLAERRSPATQSTEELQMSQFESPQAYAEALAEQKVAQLVAQREAQKAQSEVVDAYHSREEDARERFDDFDQVAYNPSLRVTNIMAEAIQSSEIGPDIAYYLGTNPKEAARIAQLTPLGQAREIGKLEAKVAATPPVVKKVSSAPAPIAPVTPRSNTSASFDTTDPRSIKSMTTSEWIAAERARQIKQAEAKRF